MSPMLLAVSGYRQGDVQVLHRQTRSLMVASTVIRGKASKGGAKACACSQRPTVC